MGVALLLGAKVGGSLVGLLVRWPALGFGGFRVRGFGIRDSGIGVPVSGDFLFAAAVLVRWPWLSGMCRISLLRLGTRLCGATTSLSMRSNSRKLTGFQSTGRFPLCSVCLTGQVIAMGDPVRKRRMRSTQKSLIVNM